MSLTNSKHFERANSIVTFPKIDEEELDRHDAGTSALLPSSHHSEDSDSQQYSSSYDSDEFNSDYKKDPNWKKLTLAEKERLKRRIMH